MTDVVNYSPSLLSIRKINNYGHNTGVTQTENRKLLIRLIKEAGEISRKDLATESGLKQATVTIIINDFIKRGLVEETGLIDNGNVRRARGIRLVNYCCTISVRLNSSYLSVAIYDVYGTNMYCYKKFMDTLIHPIHTCDVLQQEIETAVAACVSDSMQVLGIGMGVEGSFVIKNQRYQLYNVKDQTYFDFVAELSKRVPYPVLINRMSNYNAYYVWKKMWNDDLGVIVTFMISYTLECGIIVNGEMLNGSQGMAGRIGEIACEYKEDGTPVMFKDIVSVETLLSNTSKLLPEYPDSILNNCKEQLNIRDVINAYKKKDTLALKIYNDCALYCGRAINFIIKVLNPNVVFLGDEVPLVDDFFQKVYEEAIKGVYSDFPNAELTEKRDISGFRLKVPEADRSLRLLNPGKVRGTMNDPSLLGAAEYVMDASIENGMFFKMDEKENDEITI